MAEAVGTEVAGQVGEPGQGPYMTVWITVADGRITVARYATYPCPIAHGCGGWLCRWLPTRTLAEAAAITAEDLRCVLGGLPLGKEHCADLAIEALRDALALLDDAK